MESMTPASARGGPQRYCWLTHLMADSLWEGDLGSTIPGLAQLYLQGERKVGMEGDGVEREGE